MFGTSVYAPVVALNADSLYGPSTTCHSGLVAYVLMSLDCAVKKLKILAATAGSVLQLVTIGPVADSFAQVWAGSGTSGPWPR